MNTATFLDIQQTVNYLLTRVDIGTSLGAVINLLYNCGLRIEEACELKRFTLGDTTFTIDTEKRSYNRTFSLSLLPYPYFDVLPYTPQQWNLGVISSPSSVQRFVLSNSPKIFYKDSKRITSNIFRYYYARNLEQQGYTLEQIQVAMGHSNIASTLSYLAPIYYK